jgi:hypothetical protein
MIAYKDMLFIVESTVKGIFFYRGLASAEGKVAKVDVPWKGKGTAPAVKGFFRSAASAAFLQRERIAQYLLPTQPS